MARCKASLLLFSLNIIDLSSVTILSRFIVIFIAPRCVLLQILLISTFNIVEFWLYHSSMLEHGFYIVLWLAAFKLLFFWLFFEELTFKFLLQFSRSCKDEFWYKAWDCKKSEINEWAQYTIDLGHFNVTLLRGLKSLEITLLHLGHSQNW